MSGRRTAADKCPGPKCSRTNVRAGNGGGHLSEPKISADKCPSGDRTRTNVQAPTGAQQMPNHRGICRTAKRHPAHAEGRAKCQTTPANVTGRPQMAKGLGKCRSWSPNGEPPNRSHHLARRKVGAAKCRPVSPGDAPLNPANLPLPLNAPRASTPAVRRTSARAGGADARSRLVVGFGLPARSPASPAPTYTGYHVPPGRQHDTPVPVQLGSRHRVATRTPGARRRAFCKRVRAPRRPPASPRAGALPRRHGPEGRTTGCHSFRKARVGVKL
jgi:hypothetical protein